MRILIAIQLLLLLSCSTSVRQPAGVEIEDKKLVLIIVDGVRWQEFFEVKGRSMFVPSEEKPLLLPKFWKNYAHQGIMFGNRVLHSDATISSRYRLSLPNYQNIFSGVSGKCKNNDCGVTPYQTFMERVKYEKGWSDKDVALFASWDKVAHAGAHDSNVFHIRTGLYSNAETMKNPGSGYPNLQKGDTGWEGCVWDSHTFDRAMSYLKENHPKLVAIQFVESDEFGHQGKKKNYFDSITRFDTYLDHLMKYLDSDPEYKGKTAVIVTTDHGRGNDNLIGAWKNHSPFSAANYVWLYARIPGVQAEGLIPKPNKVIEHIDIRPTIENYFGLTPFACPKDQRCGKSFLE